MARDLIISGLQRKRAVLAGEIEASKRRLREQRSALRAFDRMLRLLDTDINPARIKGIRPALRLEGFRQGEITKLTLTILRKASAPLSPRQIAEEIARIKGLSHTLDMTKRVHHNLIRLARASRVTRHGKIRQLKWSLP